MRAIRHSSRVSHLTEDRVGTGSARRAELLDLAYGYVLQHGIGDLSLRPLATAIGSSPRVLLYLFGSKDGLVRELLARARIEELAALDKAPGTSTDGTDLVDVGLHLWGWLAAPRHRGLLRLWVESYARSLIDAEGPWGGFAQQTVQDWLRILTGPTASPSRPANEPNGEPDDVPATLLLAVLRGAMLDLLATGDVDRTTRAVQTQLTEVRRRARGLPPPPGHGAIGSAR